MYLNTIQTAKSLNLHRQTITSLANKGLLPYILKNGHKFFLEEEVLSKRDDIVSRWRRNINWNYNFFNNVTEESLYWSGFILADGNLSQKTLKIELKYTEENYNHLKKLQNCLSLPDSYIKIFDKKQSYNKNYKCISFAIAYRDFPSHLKKWGIIPNKTIDFEIPSFDFTKEQFGHYLRGWFDGDGYCKKDCRCIQLCGNRKSIYWLKNQLEIFSYDGKIRIGDYFKDKPWCGIRINNTNEFISFCHGHLNLKLESKWETIFQWKNRQKYTFSS